ISGVLQRAWKQFNRRHEPADATGSIKFQPALYEFHPKAVYMDLPGRIQSFKAKPGHFKIRHHHLFGRSGRFKPIKSNIMKSKAVMLFTFFLLAFQQEDSAQANNGTLYQKDLRKIYINDDISFHFVSPEPIQYVDISTSVIQGDIPIKNICRIKAVPDSLSSKNSNASLGVVTIVGQKYIAQYDIRLTYDPKFLETQTEILPVHTNPLDVGAPALSENELKEFSLLAYKNKKRSYSITNTEHDITGSVNNIYTVDDYVILDITYINKSNLKFDLDRVKFTIEDEKIL